MKIVLTLIILLGLSQFSPHVSAEGSGGYCNPYPECDLWPDWIPSWFPDGLKTIFAEGT